MSPFTVSNLEPSSDKQSISGSCECENIVRRFLLLKRIGANLDCICSKVSSWCYPVNCLKNGLCCGTTRSEGLQAGWGLAQVHGCHEYSKEYLKKHSNHMVKQSLSIYYMTSSIRSWMHFILHTWIRLPGDSSLVSMTNLDPYQKANAKQKKMMHQRYPWKTPMIVPFLTPQLWASARFLSYLCKFHIFISFQIVEEWVIINCKAERLPVMLENGEILYLSASFSSPPNAATVLMDDRTSSATAPAFA